MRASPASFFEPASSSAYPSSSLFRSSSVDTLNARAHLPADFPPNIANPSPSHSQNHPPPNQNNYLASAGPSRVSTPQNGVPTSSSSLHGAAATGAATAGPYSHSQNGWSPAPSSLSLESAPVSRPLNHDQYSYHHRQTLNDNFPIAALSTPAARSTYSSAGSNHSGDNNLSVFDRNLTHPHRHQHQQQDPDGVETRMAAHRASVASAPPHRSSFVTTSQDDSSATMTTTSSWGLDRTSGASPSPRAGARRFQSETPKLPMSSQTQLGPQRSTFDHIGASLQPQNRLYSSPISNVRQSTPDGVSGGGGGSMEMLARAAAAVVAPQGYQSGGGGGGLGSANGGNLGIPHFEASLRSSAGSGLRYPAQSVPPPTNTSSVAAPSQTVPRGYGSSTSPSSLSGAILAPSTSSRASSVVSGPALNSSPAYPPAHTSTTTFSSSSPTPQSFVAHHHSNSVDRYGRASSSFAV